jgi:hypothetical protein
VTDAVIPPVRPVFRSLAMTIVPEAERLGDAEWSELEMLVEQALAARPVSMRRQLGMFVRLLEWLPLARYGRRFTRLDTERRTRLLERVQDSSLLLLRRGFWGLRTLVFLGYYARPGAGAEIGYRADPSGWTAR